MQLDLFNAFKNQGVINTESVVCGRVWAAGLGQSPQLVLKRGLVQCIAEQHVVCQDETGRRYRMEAHNMQEIDGMTPARLANVYNIRANGTKIAPGRKRGRKPKIRVNC